MSVLVIGGAGFIGRRMIPLLVEAGESVTCMDIDVAGATAAFAGYGDQVAVLRGDVTQFDDVVAAVQASGADKVVNLSYFIGLFASHVAFKLDIQGMDNVFEAARLFGVTHTVFASSYAVSGQQSHYGDRPIKEIDRPHPDNQYAYNKTINEWQADDYRRSHGMTITGIRPANVTGPDKRFGSIDHVNCISQPARGNSVTFPHADTTRCLIHVDDTADVFATVTLADRPEHTVYNTGGTTISLGGLANLVREFLPDADIRFEEETGGLESSGSFLVDNTRLADEFGIRYPPLRQRVKDIIDDVRRGEGLPVVA